MKKIIYKTHTLLQKLHIDYDNKYITFVDYD